MIRIVFGGDVCPMGRVESEFTKGNGEAIFHDLLGIVCDADLSIVNLECPLVTTPTPIRKVGPVLGVSKDCIAGFVAGNWDVLNLANNHSFDHGVAGLRETMAVAEQAGLRIVGAGMNLEKAKAPFITNVGGRRIVLYAMAEREFSVADAETAGANPLDLIGFVQAVQKYKQDGLFIVLLHGGQEFYPYPPPEMVRRCRFMVEMGADAVICCHAHLPLPWEVYRARPIAYGMGNLVFESRSACPEGWYQGYLARLTIEGAEVHFEAIPYCQSSAQIGAKKLERDAENAFLAEMQMKNTQLLGRAFLEEHWIDYCRSQTDRYLPWLFGYNRLMWKVRRLLLATLHSEKQVFGACNLVQCETHREVIDTIFRDQRSRS